MVSRKRSERKFRVVEACLAFGCILLVGTTTGLAAKPGPRPVMPPRLAIDVLDESNTPISSLTLSIDLTDPTFPKSQPVTIKLRSVGGGPTRVTGVFFFDSGGNLLTNTSDPQTKPGITLTPDPVGQILPADGTPLPITLRAIGVVIRPNVPLLFPIDGGFIDFEGDEAIGGFIVGVSGSLVINILQIIPFTVPTLSEWGVMIMFLLLSATGLFVLSVRHPRPALSAGAGHNEIVGTPLSRAFDLRRFSKVLAVTSGLIVISVGLASWIFGGISALDLAGSLICGAIAAFIAYLFIPSGKQKTIRR